jgi:hypothetical protein
MAEIKKADEFHKAREEELLQLFAALVERYAESSIFIFNLRVAQPAKIDVFFRPIFLLAFSSADFCSAVVCRPDTKRSAADEKTPLLTKAKDVTSDEPEAWRSMPREEIMQRTHQLSRFS